MAFVYTVSAFSLIRIKAAIFFASLHYITTGYQLIPMNFAISIFGFVWFATNPYPTFLTTKFDKCGIKLNIYTSLAISLLNTF